MKTIVKVDYGKKGLEIKLNPAWNVTVLCPVEQKKLLNPVGEIQKVIKNPAGSDSLKKIVENKRNLKKICIVVSDATRPLPSYLILEGLIKELNSYGIKDNQISILIATGLHRPSQEDEIERIIGRSLRNRLKVINHVATDKNSMRFIGTTSNKSPIFINKNYCESELKILCGYVEPHFFFGFSGGRKSISPGIAGIETIQASHSANHIASPNSRFGIYKNNPLHRHATEIAKKISPDFTVNVCINAKHQITVVAAGDLEKVHEHLVNFQLKKIFKGISEPYDIVVCGNGGYPLDMNLYQAVKSMAIGEIAVTNGGTIISVNECADGIGGEKFRELIFSGMDPKALCNKILNSEIVVPDQWEIQILTRILKKAEIYVVSNLKEDEIGNIGLKYANTVEEAIKQGLERHGEDASILILPNGPQILPILK
ncbi:MAG: hypothetical protein Lokiarch_29640 [Candidatus Lokiarchaeum sp. GC14_75]|nr:MAG: hypothetical protein Lokiarch_29640 [Candidatus Lokiarchaeum sp. GC14_75]